MKAKCTSRDTDDFRKPENIFCNTHHLIILPQFCQEVPVKQMKSHVVEAHKMQGYKYQCDVCTKRFEVKSAIRKHYREDTGNTRLRNIKLSLRGNLLIRTLFAHIYNILIADGLGFDTFCKNSLA